MYLAFGGALLIGLSLELLDSVTLRRLFGGLLVILAAFSL